MGWSHAARMVLSFVVVGMLGIVAMMAVSCVARYVRALVVVVNWLWL